MADDVAPYNQTSLPLASAWAEVQNLLAKKNITGHTVRVGWKCAEYALSQAFPDNDVRLPTLAKKGAATHKRRANSAIKQLAEGQSLPPQDNAAGGIWLSIALTLIKALLDALGK